jgi:hypothetical protein
VFGDAGGVDDAASDLGPLGVGEVAVTGCGADGAVPHVLRDLSSGALFAQPDRLVEVAG